mmetsp:Transcript_104830/g.271548  ORF Transcript_104830/g.271548 Transcript_104830/m.271548 type:complete len:223 (-) Transcript_104830:68-736(-)
MSLRAAKPHLMAAGMPSSTTLRHQRSQGAKQQRLRLRNIIHSSPPGSLTRPTTSFGLGPPAATSVRRRMHFVRGSGLPLGRWHDRRRQPRRQRQRAALLGRCKPLQLPRCSGHHRCRRMSAPLGPRPWALGSASGQQAPRLPGHRCQQALPCRRPSQQRRRQRCPSASSSTSLQSDCRRGGLTAEMPPRQRWRHSGDRGRCLRSAALQPVVTLAATAPLVAV